MVLTLIRLALKIACAALAVAIPLLAVWVASSLAAYRNGPVWLACLCGLLLFPLAPLAWEALSRWRTSRGRKLRARVLRSESLRPQDGLTFTDRLVVRTVIVSALFLTALVVRFPQTAFAALSTRGDWFLDGREGASVDRVRAGLFTAADRLQWLYNAVRDNRYQDVIDPQHEATPPPVPEASPAEPLPQRTPEPTPPPATQGTPTPEPQPTPPQPERAPDGRPMWPMPATLHPLVADLPPAVETSLEDVAKHLAAGEPDRWLRIKALHDYVADRVAFDAVAYFSRDMPPQDAATVFRTRKGVCAGYAQLLAAMGVAAGEEIVVVVGDARTESSDLTGEGHAWNAAQIDGAWYLIDPTWDSGHLDGQAFVKAYTTSNLFTPPTVFAVTHYPDEPRWQLHDPPIERGDFFRQPVMRPEFFASGLELISPTRSQVDVDGPFDVLLKRPAGRYLLARYKTDAGPEGRCTVTHAATTTVHCPLPAPGTYHVDLFGSPTEFGTYHLIGQFEVHRAGV
jgi:hypothetical protein